MKGPTGEMAQADKQDVPDSVLIIVHQEQSTPGRIGRVLEQQGVQLDIRRPACGDPLPSSLRDHAGAIIFGGPMSANDEHDYIRREIEWIGVPLAEGKPFLGVCLGAQMLSRHLGCRVYTHPDGKAEIGYYPIRPTEAGRAMCEVAFPDHVYQWHREGFEVPADANLLAEGDTFSAQAFEYGGQAYGIQFHPEVTYATMCRWTVRAHERMQLPNAQSRIEQLDGWFRYDRAVALWLDAFLRRWRNGAPKVAAPIRAPAAPVNALSERDLAGAVAL